MTETQFITWLKGFLSDKVMLTGGDIAMLRSTLSQIRKGSSTNESSPSPGKSLLHD